MSWWHSPNIDRIVKETLLKSKYAGENSPSRERGMFHRQKMIWCSNSHIL